MKMLCRKYRPLYEPCAKKENPPTSRSTELCKCLATRWRLSFKMLLSCCPCSDIMENIMKHLVWMLALFWGHFFLTKCLVGKWCKEVANMKTGNNMNRWYAPSVHGAVSNNEKHLIKKYSSLLFLYNNRICLKPRPYLHSCGSWLALRPSEPLWWNYFISGQRSPHFRPGSRG